LYQSNISFLDVPVVVRQGVKLKVTATCVLDGLPAKKCVPVLPNIMHGPTVTTLIPVSQTPHPTKNSVPREVKQFALQTTTPRHAVVMAHKVWPFKYHSVDDVWQRGTCTSLDLDFKQTVRVANGHADLPLTHLNMKTIKIIKPDGNCMSQSLSCVMTGSQDQHHVIKHKVVQHMEILPL